VRALELAKVPFEFELYHYGPYSFELDSVVAEMEVFGELDKHYKRPGYGPSYKTTTLGETSLTELTEKDLSVARLVSSKLAGFDTSDLELIATCLYVEVIEREESDSAIAPRVKEIKPKYSDTQIERALAHARKLRAELKR
jgi:uncharacterized protein YwgA